MPKIKSRKAVAKRFRVTGRGGVKYARAFRRHLLTVKNRKRKRKLGTPGLLSKADQKWVKIQLPYA